jgi:hypothetical protein
MKWKNKGHEFDEYENIFTKGKKIAIYGACAVGANLFSKMGFADCVECFIDNNREKQKKEFNGKKVLSILDYLKLCDDKQCIVVVAVGPNKRDFVMQQMRTCGYHDGNNLFDEFSFIEYYLPIYALYSWNKLFFHSLGMTLTTICNLHCKGCLAFVPHNHNQKNYDIEMFKQSLDCLFLSVDYVDILQLSGGETFLYPFQLELINYIGDKYRDRINLLYTTTNGSIFPSDELCESIKKNRVTVIVDDYSDTVPQNKKKMDKLISLFKKMEIMYLHNKVKSWIDLAPESTDNSYMTDKELEDYYMACSQPWIELFDSRLYSCNYAQYAMRAGFINDSENDSFKLKGNVSKAELLEFRMGYTNKGYVDFCKKCSGYLSINQNIITPAVQEI